MRRCGAQPLRAGSAPVAGLPSRSASRMAVIGRQNASCLFQYPRKRGRRPPPCSRARKAGRSGAGRIPCPIAGSPRCGSRSRKGARTRNARCASGGRPRRARVLSDGFHLIEDALIVARGKRWRRSEPELRPALESERSHVLKLRLGHREELRRSRFPDTRPGLGIEGVHGVPSIVCA